MRKHIIGLLAATVLSGALTAPAAAQDAQAWVAFRENDAVLIGLSTAPAADKGGSIRETSVIIAYRFPQDPQENGTAAYILSRYQVNCADRLMAVIDARGMTREGRELNCDVRPTPNWLPVVADTPNADVAAIVCDGRAVPGPALDTAA